MRRLPFVSRLIVAPLVGLAVAACSTGSGPGWTYAPAPSITPAPSASGSAEPSGSVGPSASAPQPSTPAPSNGPSGQPSATVVELAAPVGSGNTGFDPTELTAIANTPFTLAFDNQDTGVLHNVVINDPSGQAVSIGDTAFFPGPEERTYEVPALAPGAYSFVCQVHPTTMTGTLTVE